MYIAAEVFPDPRLVDPLGGLEGEERKEAVRRMFHEAKEFLISEDGLSGRPIPLLIEVPNVARFSFDLNMVKERLGLNGAREVLLAHAENCVASKSPTPFSSLTVLVFKSLNPATMAGFSAIYSALSMITESYCLPSQRAVPTGW